MSNNLQLYRNKVYFDNKKAAKDALQFQLENSSDGELVISRYAVKDKNGKVVDVKTLFGFSVSGDSGSFATICDYEDFFTNSKLQGLTVNNVPADWDETKTSLSVSVSASDINIPSEYIATSYSAIGETTFESIEVGESIGTALQTIESNIGTLIQVILDNEIVTANALTTLKDSIDLVDSKLQSQAEKITQLEQNTNIVESEIIKIEDTVDGKKFTLAEEINITCVEY